MSRIPTKFTNANAVPDGNEPAGAPAEEHGSGKKKMPHKMPDLNIVPMLDVCFNLLIFFIMVAQFSVGEGILPADLPKGDSGKASTAPVKPEEAPLIIGLVSDGGANVTIDIPGQATPSDFKGLFALLSELQTKGTYSVESPIIIRPDDNVPWTHVVDAFNAAVRAKFTNVNFGQPVKSN